MSNKEELCTPIEFKDLESCYEVNNFLLCDKKTWRMPNGESCVRNAMEGLALISCSTREECLWTTNKNWEKKLDKNQKREVKKFKNQLLKDIL